MGKWNKWKMEYMENEKNTEFDVIIFLFSKKLICFVKQHMKFRIFPAFIWLALFRNILMPLEQRSLVRSNYQSFWQIHRNDLKT